MEAVDPHNMFGKNPILGLKSDNGNYLDVVEIFPTIQGEGIFVGTPSVFLRLGGCNLACKFCDTEFDNFKEIEVNQIIDQIEKYSLNSAGKRVFNLVVITGGEPFRQPIEKICDILINKGFLVQIETNGLLYRKINKNVSIICSPKVSAEGNYFHVNQNLLPSINALKFIISANQKNYSSLPSWLEEIEKDYKNIAIYVQPMDEYDDNLNNDNLELTKTIALTNGYKISLQTHKIMKIK